MPTGLRRVKDPMFVLAAFSAWSAAHSEGEEKSRPHLVIAGPELEADVVDQVKRAATTLPGVHYVGSISREQMVAAVAQSYAVVNSSESEGLSNAMLEAMAAGCPVFARSNASACALFGTGTAVSY
jgi:glycosyltransferase involved in cell wall biosynthesis